MNDLNIINYFVSDEFYEVVKKLKTLYGINYYKYENVSYLISLAMNYAIINGEKNNPSFIGVSEFLTDVLETTATLLKENAQYNEKIHDNEIFYFRYIEDVDKRIKRKLIAPILKRLGKNELSELDEETKKAIFKQFYINYYKADYKYHSFNSCSLDSIKKYGINPNKKMTAQEDIDRINDIFVKYGIERIFGWQKSNCENNVFYSESLSPLLYYGKSSPEWFSQFTGESNSYSYQEGLTKDAYALRDYSAAQNNLLKIMEINQFSLEEVNEVMNFFETEWKKYGHSTPMAVIIPNNHKEDSEKNIEIYYDYICNFRCEAPEIENIINYFIDGGKWDVATSDCIDTTDAIYIQLPSIKRIMNDVLKINEEDYCYSKEEFSKILSCLHSNSDEVDYFEIKKFFNSAIKYLDVQSLTELLKNKKISFKLSHDETGELVKKIALLNPTCFNEVSHIWRDNLMFMRACARQKGIHPTLLYYVDENVQDDMLFITNIINNSTAETFDFYDNSKEHLKESCLKYTQFIGPNVKKNLFFGIY